MSANPQERENDDNVQVGTSRQARASQYRQRKRGSSQQQKGKQASKTKENQEAKHLWLKVFLVLACALIALVAGLMIGYGVLGGQNPLQALNVDTWQHLYRMVFG